MLATQDIERQAYSNSCATTTIINLYKLRGLEPPPFEAIEEAFAMLKQQAGWQEVIGDSECPTSMDVLNLLSVLGNFVCALAAIPSLNYHEPQKILRPFLDSGCHLLLFFNWRDPWSGEVCTHITLAEGYDKEGYKVIDGEPSYLPEGAPFELEPEIIQPEEMERIKALIENKPYGSRRTLPFFGVGAAQLQSAPGLLAHVIVVYPSYE